MPLLELEKPRIFKGVKEAPVLLLLIILLADICFNWLYVHVYREAFSVPGLYTGNLIQPLFVLSALKLTFVAAGLAIWIGGFRRRHLGMSWKHLKVGLLTTAFLWAMIQLVQIVDSVVSRGRIGYISTPEGAAIPIVIGQFLLFAAGKALYDELIYRGLLMPQMHLKLQRYINLPARVLLASALVISQLIYVLIQLPLIELPHVNEFSSVVTVSSLFFMSLLNALVYLRTKNLYISAGIHALWYAPLFVVIPTIPHTIILGLLIMLFIVLWPLLPNAPSLVATWPLEERRR